MKKKNKFKNRIINYFKMNTKNFKNFKIKELKEFLIIKDKIKIFKYKIILKKFKNFQNFFKIK